MLSNIKGFLKQRFPRLVSVGREMRGSLQAPSYRFTHSHKRQYECPICRYKGPFDDYSAEQGVIKDTRCPRCDTYERHRLLRLVFDALAAHHDFSGMSILHFAPEPRLSRYFFELFRHRHTADIAEEGVDFRVDICDLPFDDASYDVIVASHVLEHILDDRKAISEVRRVVRPGGFAVLPVPVVSKQTIEYSETNPHEFGHVRAVGPDYFDRYRSCFSRIEVWDSSHFDEKYQLYTIEDRSQYPTALSPMRTPMSGDLHPDYVPVCYP